MKKIMLYTLLILLLLFPYMITYAKRGCCSGKGGVAYCGQNGHYICKNGDPSPSCTCDGVDITTYEEDKANNNLYYKDEKSITKEDKKTRFLGDNLDNNDEYNNKKENSIEDYIGPGVVVIVIIYTIGKNSRK